jgi:hypothetical protein
MRSPRWFLIALALCGCVTAEFVSTDPSFRPRGHAMPIVYIDKLPPFPYRSVGIIEATIPDSHPLSEVMQVVATKGQEIGCDAVVDRAIHQVSAAVPVAPQQRWLVQYHPPVTSSAHIYKPPQTNYQAPPAGRREFICAVRDATPPPPAAPLVPPAPPPAPAPSPT